MADERKPRVDREIDAIAAAARSVLPSSVAVCTAAIGLQAEPLAALPPDEARYVERAVAKRQREFAAGRACARGALAQLGVAAVSIPAGPQREPVWPEGVTGSITHHGEHCVAAAQRTAVVLSLGVDLADAAPLETELVARICAADERRTLLAAAPRAWPFDPHKAFFCIKEAVYKCVFPLVRMGFGFHDVHAELDLPSRSARIRLAPRLEIDAEIHCRFATTTRHLFAGAWIAPLDDHAELPRPREHVSR